MENSQAFCLPPSGALNARPLRNGLASRRHPNSLPLKTRTALSSPITCQQVTNVPPPTPTTPPTNPKISDRLECFLKSAEEGDPFSSLSRAEAAFDKLKARATSSVKSNKPPQIVYISDNPVLPADGCPQYDVIVAGGTLGILYATALQARGWRVAVIERGEIRGRVQEWNISRDELGSLVANDVLNATQLEDCIVTECKSPGRLGFLSRDDNLRSISVSNVLNVGIAPDILVSYALSNFIAKGGTVLEKHNLKTVNIGPDGVAIKLRKMPKMKVSGSLGAGGTGLAVDDGSESVEFDVTTRLLIDAMGAFSPIAEQSRGGRVPDGVCITVGASMAADNWPQSLDVPDIMVSRSPINGERSSQYFWEAFPVGRDPNARTAYMFSYGHCDETRQTLTSALEDFVDSIEGYQGLSVDKMTSVKRILFGFFPSYYRSATPSAVSHDRVLPVGDAGGLQSPISFGGFGCCVRHLPRICSSVTEALDDKSDRLLTKKNLGLIQWYLPSLAVTGLFHKAMSVSSGATTAGPLLDEFGINDVLWTNMKALKAAGEDTQLSFLRDVVTAPGLSKTLAIMATTNPILATRLSAFVGPVELIDWTRHYIALVGYASARPLIKAIRDWALEHSSMSTEQKFWWNRFVDGVTYGSGYDAVSHQ